MDDADQLEGTGLSLHPTPAEEKLIAAARLGRTCDLSKASDADRTIRAEVIRILCIAARPDWPSGERGVALENAIVTGELDFRSAALVVPLKLVNCHFDADIDLSEAQARTTTISSSSIGAFVSDGARFAGNLVLNSTTASRGISLTRTMVAGYLDCSSSTLQTGNGYALNADSLDVSGGAFFRDGFAAEGEVNLLGAKVGKSLDFSGARLENAGGYALNGPASYVYLTSTLATGVAMLITWRRSDQWTRAALVALIPWLALVVTGPGLPPLSSARRTDPMGP